MFQITRSMYTETAHLLRNHPGKCRFLHGHSYKWSVYVDCEHLSNGMVMDFTDLKEIMNRIIEPYDHALVVDTDTWCVLKQVFHDDTRVVVYVDRPTAEVMARTVFRGIRELLPEGCEIRGVTCRETENNEAHYYE